MDLKNLYPSLVGKKILFRGKKSFLGSLGLDGFFFVSMNPFFSVGGGLIIIFFNSLKYFLYLRAAGYKPILKLSQHLENPSGLILKGKGFKLNNKFKFILY